MDKYIFFRKDRRVGLAVIEMEHVDFLLENMNDQKITQFLQLRKPVHRPQEEAWVKSIQEDPSNYVFLVVALDKGNPEPIGVMGLHGINWSNRRATTGAWLTSETWGKGYGTHAKMLLLDIAFHDFNLHSLQSSALASNPRSLAYNKSCGYEEVGRFREAIVDQHGDFQDEILLEVLCSEWEPVWKNWKQQEVIS